MAQGVRYSVNSLQMDSMESELSTKMSRCLQARQLHAYLHADENGG